MQHILRKCVVIWKVKVIRTQTWTGLRVPGGWRSHILRQLAHESSKVMSPKHRLPLPHPPSKILLVLIPVWGWVEPRSIMRPEGLRQWKISFAPSGIEPVTYRRLAQGFNQLHHHKERPNILSPNPDLWQYFAFCGGSENLLRICDPQLLCLK